MRTKKKKITKEFQYLRYIEKEGKEKKIRGRNYGVEER